METAHQFELGFVTDVEGNLEYFERFLEMSPVIRRCPATGDLLLAHPGAHFVFGGDAVDKGPGDIRICRALVQLKRRYPDRVALLVGNRDLNKLRLSAELGQADMARPVAEIPPPHWDRRASSLEQHLQAVAAAAGQSVDQVNTRPERLRYMYQHTLGCAHTFEFRRAELAALSDCQSSEVTDEQVVASCLHEACHPDGALRQYMELGSVAAVFGNTLFVHGCVDRLTVGFVPPSDTRFENPRVLPGPSEFVGSVHVWKDGMNRLLRAGLADHQARPDWDQDRQTRGGEALMALQNRSAMWGRSVISNCYADGGNITSSSAVQKRDQKLAAAGGQDPLAFEGVCSDPRDTEVAAWLLNSGIRRVVVGHKPCGDSPAVCSAVYTGVEIVSADTSFSDTRCDDNRGCAVSSVLIRGESADVNHVLLHGVLRDGREHCGRLATLGAGDGADGDPYLGTEIMDGWWVKAKLQTPDEPGEDVGEARYRVSRGEGRKVEYDDRSESELRAALLTTQPDS